MIDIVEPNKSKLEHYIIDKKLKSKSEGVIMILSEYFKNYKRRNNGIYKL